MNEKAQIDISICYVIFFVSSLDGCAGAAPNQTYKENPQYTGHTSGTGYISSGCRKFIKHVIYMIKWSSVVKCWLSSQNLFLKVATSASRSWGVLVQSDFSVCALLSITYFYFVADKSWGIFCPTIIMSPQIFRIPVAATTFDATSPL